MLSEFGRIGRDAELRYTAQGTAVCGVSVAYNYGCKDQNGDRPTQWIEVVLWGKQAEALAQYLTKGKQIYFSARDIRVEEFQKKDGAQGSKLTGDLVDIKFASDGSSQGGQQYQQQAQHPQQYQQQPQQQYQQPQQQMQGQQQQQQQYQPRQQQQQQQKQGQSDPFMDDVPFDNPYRGTRSLVV